MSETIEITPAEAALRLQHRNQAVLIDVREPEEFAVAQVPGAQLIPMQSVPAELQRLEGLADERELLVICHHGVRSLQVVQWLREQGVENCFSISGGIDRWSSDVDTDVPRY